MKKALLSIGVLFLGILAQGQTLPPTSNSQTVCVGSSAVLTASSTQPGATFTWWDQATSGTLLGSGATYTTPPLSSGTVFYVQAEIGGVPSLRTSVSTSVANNPTVGTTQDTIYACSGDPVAVSATIKQNIGQVSWYDAASGGTLLATGNTYTLPSIAPGTTSYFAEAAIGNCVNPVRTEAVVINVDGQITPTISPTSFSVCFGQSVTLTGTSNVPGFEVEWYTDPVGGTLIGTGSPLVFTPPTTMTVYAQIELNNIACDNEARVPVDITVFQQLLSPANLRCTGSTPSSVSFAWDPVPGATGYEVSLDGGATWIPANQPPTSHVVSGLPENTQQTLRVRALDGTNGCPPGKETADKTCVTLDCGPLNVSVQPLYETCVGGEVTVFINGMISGIHVVNVNGAVTSESEFTFTPTADTTLNFIVFNSNYPECDSAALTSTVQVYEVPSANPTATAQDSAFPGASVNTYLFEANSGSNVSSWNWDFGDGANATTENATHEYSDPGSYTVTLTVTTDDGCTATFTLTATVEVFEVPEIFIPNSFTPNGDMNNDVLYIFGEFVELQQFIIFNQYGDAVFKTSDISEGWDGTWKGKAQPGGVYVYSAVLTDSVGNTYQEQGTITLIR